MQSAPRGTPGHPIGPRPRRELPGGNGGAEVAASVREGGWASMDRFVVRRARSPQSPRRAAPGPRACRQVTLESLKAGHRREGAGARPGRGGGGAAGCEHRFCTEISAALRWGPDREGVIQRLYRCRGLCCLGRGSMRRQAGHTIRGQPGDKASLGISSWLSSLSRKKRFGAFNACPA